MKLKHFALILSAITFSQATLAAAPLCRSVLRSFTQEQINAAIEDFTRLTLQADNAQADGDKSTMTRSLLASKRVKEKELLENLNISREELRKLVSERSAVLQKRTEDKTEAEVNARESMRPKKFERVKSFAESFAHSTTFDFVANNSVLFIKSYTSNAIYFMSTEKRAQTQLRGTPSAFLTDTVFSHERIYNGVKSVVTNFQTGSQIEIPNPKGHYIISSDKQSVVDSPGFKNVRFEYSHIDKNGAILDQGIVADLFGAELKYVGKHAWLLRQERGFTLFNPKTKEVFPLDIPESSLVTGLQDGRVALQDGKKLYVINTNSEQSISRDIPADFEISHSSSKFIWLKFKDPTNGTQAILRSFDSNTLAEVPGTAITVKNSYVLKAAEQSDLVSVYQEASDGTKAYIGIYRNHDLLNPVFDVQKLYPSRKIKELSLSEDGQSVIVISKDPYSTNNSFHFDVWKLK